MEWNNHQQNSDRQHHIASQESESRAVCPVCAALGTSPYMREGRFTLRRCRQCALIFRENRQSELETGFQDTSVDAAYQNLAVAIDMINQRLALEILDLLHHEGLPQNANIMEIGCGTAAIGKAIAASHPASSYIGIEPSGRFSQPFPQEIGGVKVSSSVTESGIAPGSQDALIFNHVLEHVPDPVAFLRAHLIWLKPEGLIYVEVPNEQWKKLISYPMRLVRNTDQTIFGGHINFFTVTSLARTLGISGLELRLMRKGYIGDSADQVRRLCGDASVLERNWKIALVYRCCRLFKIDRLMDYGLVIRSIGRKPRYETLT